MKYLIPFFLLLCLVIADMPHASAATFETGRDITIRNTHTNDLYLAGSEIQVEGSIEGDLYAAGYNVVILDTIAGDLVAAGSNVRVEGNVGDDVRIFAGYAEINGTVADDVIVTSGTVVIGSRAVIGGDLIITSGNVYLNGTVRGEVRGWVGTMALNGTVEGEVAIVADQEITFGPEARVENNFRYTAWRPFDLPQEHVTGQIIFSKVGDSPQHERARLADRIQGSIFFILSFLFVSFFVFRIAPSYSLRVIEGCRKNFIINFLIGAGWLVLVPLLCLLLLISVIGIPLMLMLISIFMLSLIISWVYMARWIGSWIRGGDGTLIPSFTQALIGLLVISAFWYIPSFIIPVITLILLVCSLGAMITALLPQQSRTVTSKKSKQ